jgi:hypothetical protein
MINDLGFTKLSFAIEDWVFTYFLKYPLLMLESDHVYE